MLQVAGSPSRTGNDLASRQQIALSRIQLLIDSGEQRARRALRNYYLLQGLTVALAALTPCLIFLAKDNPNNGLLNWLQVFFPAIAAITAALLHVFRWREDAVRSTALVEAIRSQLWRYETRSAEFGGELTNEQALTRLVVNVDQLNLKSVAQWGATQLADASPPPTANATAQSAPADR